MKTQSITSITFLSLLILFGCSKEILPVASFTINKSTADVGETVSFSNLSENSTDNIWDFGDGNASAELNPTHIYENIGTYTVSLTVYGNGNKDTSMNTIEILAPPLNIEQGVRVGDFYLNEDLKTHFDKLDESKMEYSSFQKTNGEYSHTFDFTYAGIKFYLTTPNSDYTIDDFPNSIEVYTPFDGWAMGGITFGSSFDDINNVFGAPIAMAEGHIYSGIIFWADNSGLFVNRISIR